MEGLGINLWVLIGWLINFTLLLVLLSIFLYRPVTNILHERTERIKESMDKAEEINEQAAKAEEQVKDQLDSARKEGQAIIAQAGQIGERLREEAREEARREAEALIDRARSEIQRERDGVIDALRAEFVDLALLAAEKVIRESLDRDRHMRLIEEVLEESGELGKE